MSVLESQASKRLQLTLGVAVSLWLVVACFFVLAHMFTEPYDDAHFFKRIAAHALHDGTLAWNVKEGPSYGATSALFQFIAVPIYALAPSYYMVATRVFASLCLMFAFLLLFDLGRTRDRGLSAAMIMVSPVVLYPLISGMETALAICIVAIVLWLSFSERGRNAPWFVTPAVLTLLYAVRPDALLLGVFVVFADRLDRGPRGLWRQVLAFTVMLAAFLLFCWAFFGTALPLPFYAKSAAFSPYDEHFRALCRTSGWSRFLTYALFMIPSLVVAATRLDRINVALLLGVLAHALYHLTLTIDVMGMHGRFYITEVPAICFAAARGIERFASKGTIRTSLAMVGAYLSLFLLLALSHELPPQSSFKLDQVSWFSTCLTCGCLCACVLTFSMPRWWSAACLLVFGCGIVGEIPAFKLEHARAISDEEFLTLHASRYTSYRGLETLTACFGDGLDVYHSEIGVTGLRLMHGEVADLAGLMSPRWLFRPKGSFDTLCMEDQPEAIFLPHKNYRDLNREIMRGACIKGYRQAVLKSSSPLFVRKDLWPRFAACAKQRKDKWVSLK